MSDEEDPIEPVEPEEPGDGMSDVEADADALAGAGMGNDEDYRPGQSIDELHERQEETDRQRLEAGNQGDQRSPEERRQAERAAELAYWEDRLEPTPFPRPPLNAPAGQEQQQGHEPSR